MHSFCYRDSLRRDTEQSISYDTNPNEERNEEEIDRLRLRLGQTPDAVVV